MTNSKWKISFSELDNILKKLQVLLLDEISNNKKIIDELKTTYNIDFSDNLVQKITDIIRKIVEDIKKDLNFFYESDPAASSIEEIYWSYPGFFALFIYRISHELANQKIKIIPRYLSEYAHSKTGIDINPNAIIGCPCFIDHGTGIVIGETADIGNNVKIYQGVTLGAKSLSRGNLLKGVKRHPTIGNNVTIYANATILGGDTIIGDNSTIGANVFLTSSVSNNSLIVHNENNIDLTKK